VLDELVRLINTPELDHPVRADLADLYKTSRSEFNRNALDHIKKHAK
jgi:ubiquitin-conjugating enzyme E2 L3